MTVLCFKKLSPSRRKLKLIASKGRRPKKHLEEKYAPIKYIPGVIVIETYLKMRVKFG